MANGKTARIISILRRILTDGQLVKTLILDSCNDIMTSIIDTDTSIITLRNFLNEAWIQIFD